MKDHINTKASWRDYLKLTKPGILRSNLFAALAGFWVASQWSIAWDLLLFTLIGTALVLASSLVFNNYLDLEFDRRMERTRDRALPAGVITPKQAIWFGSVLGVLGFAVLFGLVGVLAGLLGVAGIFFYVVVYTAWLKRTSTLSTAVGAISGSVPPVIGYCGARGEIDAGFWILFAILFLWQPPHFWALGIRRREEYAAAGFVILPVVKGIKRTKWQMLPYLVLIIPANVLLYTYGYVGIYYLVVAVVLGIVWLGLSIAGFWAEDDQKWATKVFVFSIIYLTVLFIMMIVNTTASTL